MNSPSPTASYSLTVRVELHNVPGAFARVATAIGKAGGSLGSVDLVAVHDGRTLRDVVVFAGNEAQSRQVVESIRRVRGARVRGISDRTFLTHIGGKIEIVSRVPVKTRDDLSMIYTPGVGRVSTAIADDPSLAWKMTMKKNTVAIVSDGTAVLGLGDLGPLGALPVMEGKAILFKNFAGVDAFPLVLDTKNPKEIVDTVVRIAPGFGGINLEDISSPRCFEIEQELQKRLDIPVMHDDQHGTAVVLLAGMLNALKVTHRKFKDLRVVMTGAGAAGVACAEILLKAGVKDLITCDRKGAIYKGRLEGMNPIKERLAAKTNPRGVKGPVGGALKGAHVYIGLSGPGTVKVSELRRMAPRPLLFLMANPTPEVMPEKVDRFAGAIGTGRSDYPNQVNNALAFPGIFRGALDVRARAITPRMKLAAARAIAKCIPERELSRDYIIPSIFNAQVAPAVAAAVSRAAYDSGVARRRRIPLPNEAAIPVPRAKR